MEFAEMRCMHDHQGNNYQARKSNTAARENLVELVEGSSAEHGLGSIWPDSQLGTDHLKKQFMQ
jgi:hypothetical protein